VVRARTQGKCFTRDLQEPEEPEAPVRMMTQLASLETA